MDAALRGGPCCEVPLSCVRPWTDNFSPARLRGQGAFGEVFEGMYDALDAARGGVRVTGAVAVKRLHPRILLQGTATDHQAALACMRREVNVLSAFRHPHVIRLLAHTPLAEAEAGLCLVYELGALGSLADILRDDARAAALSPADRLGAAQGLAKALSYLHCHDPQAPAYHRDVKSANVVLTADRVAKLIDCGLAKYAGANKALGTVVTAAGAVPGTPGYMCPTVS